MKPSFFSLSRIAWYMGIGTLLSCAPVAIQEEEQEQERYQVRIFYDPAAPQAIRGFFHLGRVYSITMGSAGVGMAAGSPRDLDAIIDAVNELTDVRAEFASGISYSDPRIFSLPIVIPQSLPNEVEMEQLTRYLLAGGFILDLDLGFEPYREGLEKFGGLVWGRDAWIERLAPDQPIFTAFFEIQGGVPQSGPPQVRRGRPEHMQGIFINGRLAGVQFALQEPPINTTLATQLQRIEPTEEEIEARNQRRDDFRRRQMAVNIVVYALTQEGSIAQRLMRGDGSSGDDTEQ